MGTANTEEVEVKTSVAEALEITKARERYDAACLRLLSEKIVLAWILKSCVAEFADVDVKRIAEECIEGTPRVREVSAEPDQTGPTIRGMNPVQKSLTEGTAIFDIYFSAIAPGTGEVIHLIINVEAQADYYPGYPLPKRGIYYCGRMISAQKGTVFWKDDYGKLQKVYSIWVFPMPPEARENTITSYSIEEHNVIGEAHEAKKNYDLLTMVMICLGDEGGDHYEGVIKLLGTLLTSGATVEEKGRILEEEFDIPMTEKMEREVTTMGGSFFDIALENRVKREVEKRLKIEHDQMENRLKIERDQGLEDGMEKGRGQDVRMLMKNLGLSFEKALAALGVPHEQWGRYAQMVGQQPV